MTEMACGAAAGWYVRGCKRKADGTLHGRHSWFVGMPEATIASLKKEEDASSGKFQLCFGRDGSYVGLTGSSDYISRSAPDRLEARMARMRSQNKMIKVARLFHLSRASYFLSDAEGTDWGGLNSDLSGHLKNGGKDEILDVICAADQSWVVLRPGRFMPSKGIAPKLRDRLTRFFQEQKKRRRATNKRVQAYNSKVHREATRNSYPRQLAKQQRQLEVPILVDTCTRKNSTSANWREEAAQRKREEVVQHMLAKRRAVEVQSFIRGKGLREGSVVTMAELGEASRAVVTMLSNDGVEIRVREGRDETMFVRDPRKLVVADPGHLDDTSEIPSMLFFDVDKYEASLCLITSCECSEIFRGSTSK